MMSGGGEEKKTIADDLVVTKYKMAAETANKVLRDLVAACTEGSSVRELCMMGDNKILEETGKAYKKDKKMSKGGRLRLMFCKHYNIYCSRNLLPHLHLSQQHRVSLLPPTL